MRTCDPCLRSTLFRLEDVETGTEIHNSRTNKPDAAGVIAGVPEHNIRIKQALRIPHTQSIGEFGADSAIKNVATYEAYIAGLAELSGSNYQAAVSAFDVALAWETLDSIPAESPGDNCSPMTTYPTLLALTRSSLILRPYLSPNYQALPNLN